MSKTPEELLAEIEAAWGEEMSSPLKAYMDARLGTASHSNDPDAQRAQANMQARDIDSAETDLLNALQDGDDAKRDAAAKRLQQRAEWVEIGKWNVR